MDEERIDTELRGKTLQVYWYMVKSSGKSVGVREVQRALRFSSPRLAAYHLEKLEQLGLVKNELGEYSLVKEVKVGILKQFVRIGGLMLPRYLFYATMFSTFLLYAVVMFKEPTSWSLFGLILSTLGTVISWYETLQIWHQRR